ncbi:MAG: hypothetical protein BIFFINMI_00976 [Phycisphaerae bacterium]|nr:hypothetical protein [Phycisphaerae bacterium]
MPGAGNAECKMVNRIEPLLIEHLSFCTLHFSFPPGNDPECRGVLNYNIFMENDLWIVR